jgi:hypothetical protein
MNEKEEVIDHFASSAKVKMVAGAFHRGPSECNRIG